MYKDNIYVLTGGDNILDDLKEAYHQEFDACLEEYNKGKRSDRQIDDCKCQYKNVVFIKNNSVVKPTFLFLIFKRNIA